MKTTKKLKGTGASWFAASPARGSSCKRFLLWLKWMIRHDAIDPGIWQKRDLINSRLPAPSADRLFMPIDTHIHQWAIKYKATHSNNLSWKTTEEITKFFAKICPEDPLRHDFAICHYGMMNYRNLE